MDDCIEKQLKDFILSRYKSVRAFAICANIPTSTFATILERGVRSANINTIFQICDSLSIDIDALMANKIVEKKDANSTALAQKDNSIVAVSQSGKRYTFHFSEKNFKLLVDLATALEKSE